MNKIIVFILLFVLFSLTACNTHGDNFKIYKDIPKNVEYLQDIEYGKVLGTSLKLNILRPRQQTVKPLPVILWIHGGGWEEGSRVDFLGELSSITECGYLCASIEYRLSDKALFPAQIEDCKCAIRFLRANAKKYNIDTSHIGAWGGSAGGHLAALLGASNGYKELEGSGGYNKYSSKIQAACDWFGPVDFRSYLLPGDSNVARLLGGPPQQNMKEAAEASPVVYISKESAPFLMMVGDRDDSFKILENTGKEFCKKLKALNIPADFKLVPGAGHGFNNPEDYRKVKIFFDKYLKK